MKIILSRKGFDSAAGRYPSPLLIEENQLISFPIPENDMDTGITYKDLDFNENFTYANIMNDLGINDFENKYVHLDPDLNQSTIRNRDNDWRGIFGQCNSSQSHLSNQNVGKGDLFLFFGWFREVKRINNRYTYIKGTDKHIIWGYLQVGEIQSISRQAKYEKWKNMHPHYYCRNRDKNTAYISADKLSFDNLKPGYGCLKYNKPLVLTCDGQEKRSLWKLPSYFHPKFNTKMTFHEKIAAKNENPIWKLNSDHCTLQTVGRGQEFVITGNKKVEEWAQDLILNN
ncbi:hypothetical protein [Sedimentibacter sp. B4]|uniref:Nmad3 family putative nucleotide modification protein n=1 Tax=Sedimentibacter sp. B4 TaxID=304766 RepID=UPI0003171F95|nr:hypothetical protein [Sedimentibacter sp. B4]